MWEATAIYKKKQNKDFCYYFLIILLVMKKILKNTINAQLFYR